MITCVLTTGGSLSGCMTSGGAFRADDNDSGAYQWARNAEVIEGHEVFVRDGDRLVKAVGDIPFGAPVPVRTNSIKLK